MFKKLKPTEVARYYDEWTTRYLEGFGEVFQSKQAETPEKLADYYISQMGLEPGMQVLDAGCGIAGPAVHIAQKIAVNIDCITISEVQLTMAKTHVHEAGLENQVKVYPGDFHELTQVAPQKLYDIIYFLESLVHSPDPARVLKEAYQLLKPDGVIYIKDLYEKTAYSNEEKKGILHWVKHNNKHIKLNIIKKEDLLMMLRNQGFQLECCQLMKIPTNQDLGNKFVVTNGIMPDPIANSLQPYLEWYEIKAIKPGPGLVFKM
jgi:2-polyprenyl-3-methyl-5-hydroxy-6-metoxy-1,4-benzoquinol methylase